MAKWIKKVSSAPLRVVGHILDSLSGNSTENAPSIRAVNSALNAINVPLGDLSDYGENHTLVDAVGVLTTAEQSRYEDLTGALVTDDTYIDSCSLVRYGRVFELRASLKNVPNGTQLSNILTIPSTYVRGGMIAVTMTAWGIGTPSYRNAIIKSDGKLEVKASFTEETMRFKISATWIY